MPGLVLDCSVTAGLVLNDEFDEYVERVFEEVEEKGALVPSIWQLEVANLLLNSIKRKRLTHADTEIFFDLLDTLAITEQDDFTRADIYALARKYTLTAYDAAYLFVAIKSGLPLASKDRELNLAAQQAGVALFI